MRKIFKEGQDCGFGPFVIPKILKKKLRCKIPSMGLAIPNLEFTYTRLTWPTHSSRTY
jgi:hypothetical protein